MIERNNHSKSTKPSCIATQAYRKLMKRRLLPIPPLEKKKKRNSSEWQTRRGDGGLGSRAIYRCPVGFTALQIALGRFRPRIGPVENNSFR